MITIRSSKESSKATLICMEVTLKTLGHVYTISSERAFADSASSFGHGLFGGISWPVSRFRIGEKLLLEQQLFLPHDESTVAISWALYGDASTAAQLVVRPFFSGCGPRLYRDLGFHTDSNDKAGRLTWLPNVLGPKVLADTNGRYQDESPALFACFSAPTAASASEEGLITPGRFEFELGRRPSVLIFSTENPAASRRDQHIGLFLAGLMEESAFRTATFVRSSVGTSTQQRVLHD